jgi:hypothetical protein
MQKSKERIISFFDVVLTAYTYGQKLSLPPLPLINFMRQVEAWYTAGTCPQMGRKSAETIYLADIKVSTNGKRVDLLINRSDRDASDTVYSNPQNNQVRNFPKNAGEGNDFSAHMVINLVGSGSMYEAALEVSPGLASGKVARFLNHLIRHCIKDNQSAYQVPHPDGSTNAAGVPRVVTAYHKAELTGHPSKDLLNSINGGVLESIEIIDKRKKNLNWDTNGNTKEIQRAVILRVGPKANAKNFSRVKEAAALAFQRHYGEARVKFKTPDGLPSTVTLETQNMQLANDSIYVKKEKISGFTSLLDSSSQQLNSEIVDKMARLL